MVSDGEGGSSAQRGEGEGNSKNSISLHQQLSFGLQEGRARKERRSQLHSRGREEGGKGKPNHRAG
jgi:hypothetical protein